MTLKPVPTSGRFMVTSSVVITFEPRVQLYVPQEEIFPYFTEIHLCDQGLLTLIWMCCKKNACRRLLECRMWIRSLSDSWSRIPTNSLFWKKNLPRDVCGLGGDWQKFKRLRRPDHVRPEVLTKIGKAAQNREKQEWEKRNVKARLCSTTERNLLHWSRRRKCRQILTNAGRKFTRTLAPTMPCERQPSIVKTAKPKIGNPKMSFKNYVMVVLVESLMNLRDNEQNRIAGQKNHELHIAGRGLTSIHHNLVNKFILMLQAMKIPNAKAAGGQGMEKSSWRSQHGNLENSPRAKRRSFSDARRDKNNVHFATLMDMSSTSNKRWVRTQNYKKYKGSVELRGDTVKDDSGAYAVFCWTGLVCVPNDCRKSNGCHWKITRLSTDKQLMQYPRTLRENWRTLPDCSKILSQNVQTHGYVFHDTHCQNHGQTLKIQWWLWNEICTDTHQHDCLWKDSSKKLYWNLEVKKYQIGNVCSSKTMIILIGIRGRHKNGWKKQNMAPMWNVMDETCGSWWPTSFLDHVYLGCTQSWWQTEWNHYWGVFKGVWITFFFWSNWKFTKSGKTSRKDGCVVLLTDIASWQTKKWSS